MRKILNRLHAGPLVDSMIAVVMAALFISFVILLIGRNPLAIISLFVCGGLGDLESLYGTLMTSMPLLFAGLSVAVAFRAGLFNIGAEGQFFIGGLAAAFIGARLDLGLLTVPAMMLAAAGAGFLWAMVPICIRVYRGAHEVIGCIMMNYVAILMCRWVVRGPFKAAPDTDWRSPWIMDSGRMTVLGSVGATEFSSAFFLAVFLAAAAYWVLFHMPFGFELRSVGANPGAARASGIGVNRTLLVAFGISGAAAAVGGAAQVTGVYGTFYTQFSPGYGFEGITVALLARNHPIGVVAAALLFGLMRSASKLLQFEAEMSPDLVFLFQGVVIIALIAAEPIRRSLAGLFRREA